MQVRSNRTRGWLWMHNDILDRFGEQLGPYGIAVYVALARMTDNDSQGCTPAVKTLCKKTGMSEAKVRRVLHDLAVMQLIEIRERTSTKGTVSNEYVLLNLPEELTTTEDPPLYEVQAPLSDVQGPPVQQIPPPCTADTPPLYEVQPFYKDSSSKDFREQDSSSFVQQPKNGHAGTSEKEWPEEFLSVKKLLSKLEILPPFNDPTYWQAIEAWTDTCGFQIYYLDELRAYHAYQMSLKAGARSKHKDMKKGFRSWIANAINFRRRDAERKANWQQQRR